MTNILVTGGAGFIGSNFVLYWLETHPDDTVINLDALTYAGTTNSLAGLSPAHANRHVFVHGSINNGELVDHVLKTYRPQVVVNFAAESHNSRAIQNPALFYETNVLGTISMMDSILRIGGVERFHHISTCEVYGDLALDDSGSFSEDSPYRPNTPYNSSKASADLAVRSYGHTFGLPVTISNCANNYGPYQFPEKVIPYFVSRALRNEALPVYSSSKNRREWLHVRDHCVAIESILRRGRVGETYNVGSNDELDLDSLADHILATLGKPSALKQYVPDRPAHDRRYLLDSSKIRSELGWRPSVNLTSGLNATIDWYKTNESWWRPLLDRVPVDESGWKNRPS